MAAPRFAGPQRILVKPITLVALMVGVTLAFALVYRFVLVGDPIWMFNDGQANAIVFAGDSSATIPYGQWGALTTPTGETLDVEVKFDNRETKEFQMHLEHREDFPNAHAYSLAGKGCFALVDVSAVYGGDAQSKSITVHTRYRDQHVMEARVDGSTMIPPGPLPKEFVWNRGAPRLLQFRNVDCALAADPDPDALTRALNAELMPSMKRQ